MGDEHGAVNVGVVHFLDICDGEEVEGEGGTEGNSSIVYEDVDFAKGLNSGFDG